MAVEVYNLRAVPGRVGRQYYAGVTQGITVPAPYVDKDPHQLGNQLTPELLTRILQTRNVGDLQDWCDLANEARRKDPHLHSQLAIREQSVVETEFRLMPGKGSDARGNKRNAKTAVAACTALRQEWRRRGLERWIAEIVAANYYGRSCHEVIWERVDGLTVPVALERVHERRLSYACDPRDPNPWVLRLWDRDAWDSSFGGIYGVPLTAFHPDKFLVHEPRVAGGTQAEEGLFAVVVWYWLFRTWSWRDLMALAEMLGRPPVVAYYAAGGARSGREGEFNAARPASPAEIALADRTARKLTSALRQALPDTIRLEALKFQLPTAEPMQLLSSKEIDRLQSKAINGVDSVSDLKPGARAAVEVQERTTYTFWRADCRAYAALEEELYRRFVRANPDRFGETCPVPCVVPQTDPPRDTKAVAEGLQLAQGLGIKVPRAWGYQALGIPEPAEASDGTVEPVLEPPAPKPLPVPAGPRDRKAPPTSADGAPPATE